MRTRPALVAALCCAGLLLGTAPASAEQGPHTSCTVRASPTQFYKGEAWAGIVQKTPDEWWLTNVYTNVTSSKGLPIRGDHQMTVKVFAVEPDGVGTREVHARDVLRIPNADNPLTHDVWPWIPVPKGRTIILLQTWTEMDRWPRSCDVTGLPF